jgi:hypothetical protein
VRSPKNGLRTGPPERYFSKKIAEKKAATEPGAGWVERKPRLFVLRPKTRRVDAIIVDVNAIEQMRVKEHIDVERAAISLDDTQRIGPPPS